MVLVAAYRSLGGTPPQAAESGVLLRCLHASLRDSLADLSTTLEAAAAAASPDGDSAREGRRVSAAVQQTLDRLPPATELDDNDAAARALLAAAAEDTAWAWRMLQTGAPASPGLTAAVTALADHATDCCAEALRLLASPLESEPVNRL